MHVPERRPSWWADSFSLHTPPTVPWSREWDLLEGDAAVWIELLPSQDGGRREPIYLAREHSARYRPHFRLREGTTALLGVEFIDGPEEPLRPGSGGYASVRFLNKPAVDYSRLHVGTDFEILEGPTVIGHGRVMERSAPIQQKISFKIRP